MRNVTRNLPQALSDESKISELSQEDKRRVAADHATSDVVVLGNRLVKEYA
jgi:hypothetical protein